MKLYPYEKGRAEKVVAILKGGGAQNVLPWLEAGGGGAQNVSDLRFPHFLAPSPTP